MNQEEIIQLQLCAYIRAHYPEVIFTSDLSGVRLPIGLAKKIKMLRGQRGIPDLIVFYPAGGYYGLLIELKSTDAKVFRRDGTLVANDHYREQLNIIIQLRELGYAAYFVRGLMTGKKCIENYMKLGLTTGEQDQRSLLDQDECPIEYT